MHKGTSQDTPATTEISQDSVSVTKNTIRIFSTALIDIRFNGCRMRTPRKKAHGTIASITEETTGAYAATKKMTMTTPISMMMTMPTTIFTETMTIAKIKNAMGRGNGTSTTKTTPTDSTASKMMMTSTVTEGVAIALTMIPITKSTSTPATSVREVAATPPTFDTD